MAMYKAERPWVMAFAISVICTYYIAVCLFLLYPDATTELDPWMDAELYKKTWVVIYEQMPARMAPYGFGMYAAYRHLYCDDFEYLNKGSTVFLEWISFLIFIALSFLGAVPLVVGTLITNPTVMLFW